MYDEEEANGLIKSSGREAKIFFKDNQVDKVYLYKDPVTEYHPEQLVKGNEKDFTLPTFIIYSNKPQKEQLLKDR